MRRFIAPEHTTGPGFELSSWMPGDGPALTEAVEASYEHLAPFMPWARASQPVEVSEDLVRVFRAHWLLAKDFVIPIWSPGRTLVLGGTGFHLRQGPIEDGCVEIGMWIRGDRAHHGLGTDVLRTMVRWGFAEWGFRRLVWKCDARNAASIRVAEKVGFTLEGTHIAESTRPDGTRRDAHVFALLED
jgi:RimJ/RimL family protein N-acetyltransferase